MLWVAGSLPRYVMTSPQPTSSIDPSETTALKPTFSRLLQSRTAVSRAPLWLTKPTVPGAEIPAANVALRPVGGRMTPRPVSYTHLRAHETRHDLVCRLLLEKKKKKK